MLKKKKWRLVEAAATLAGAAIAGKAVEKGWSRASGRKPPKVPGARGVRWRDALAFAVVSGAVIAVSQLVATGAAAAAWKKVAGRKPPR